MMSFSFWVAAIVLFTQTVWSNNPATFIGCIKDGSFSFDYTGGADGTSSDAACAASCPRGYPYAFIYRAVENGRQVVTCNCYYIATGYGQEPTGDDYVWVGSSSSGSCPQGSYAWWRTATTFVFDQCVSSYSGTSVGPTVSVSTIPQCFRQCRYNTAAAMKPLSNGAFECTCMASATPGPPASCQVNSVQLYSHSQVAAVSGLAKRREMERAALSSKPSLCPGNLIPCAVKVGSTAYECIDTQSELESCGGCTSGIALGADFSTLEYDNATIGLNCDAAQGVAEGASTCINGDCVAFACQDGWYLEQDKCANELFRS